MRVVGIELARVQWIVLAVGIAAVGCAADGSDTHEQGSGQGPQTGAGAGGQGDLGAGGDLVGDATGTGATGGGSEQCQVGSMRDCYPGDETEVGVGTCVAGSQTCAASGEFGSWGECTGAVTPVAEVCGDMLDNDCDGTVDNGCCAPTMYSLTTGFTASGGSICCTGTDMLLGATDCGDGDDHWVMTQDNCGFAYEGSDNNGGPCVAIQCSGQMCM